MGCVRAAALRTGLVLGAVLLTLLLAEVVLRVATPKEFLGARQPFGLTFLAWNPFRGEYLIAGHEQPWLSINRAGLRGPELDPTRDHQIVCLGDSSTFGLWVEGKAQERVLHLDSYPAALGSLLATGGYDEWQVVNAGVPGSHAAHSLRILRREILPIEPEIVTLRVGVNDHAPQKRPWQDDPKAPWLRHLFYTFSDWKLLHLGLTSQFQLSPSGPRRRMVPIDAFRRALEAIVAESRQHDFRLLLIDYPLRPPLATDPVAKRIAALFGHEEVANFYRIHALYQEAVRSVAHANNIPLLITAPALNDTDTSGFTDDNVHPDASGMEDTAELIYAELIDRGWLRGGEPGAR